MCVLLVVLIFCSLCTIHHYMHIITLVGMYVIVVHCTDSANYFKSWSACSQWHCWLWSVWRCKMQVFHNELLHHNHEEHFLPDSVIPQIFSSIKSIYQFHNDFLLPQLELCITNWSVHTIHDTCIMYIIHNRMRSKFGQQAFSYAAPAAWNSLPPTLQQMSNTASFKRHLKTLLYQLAYPD